MPSDTMHLLVDPLQVVPQEASSKPNLLQLALKEERTQWPTRKTIWLIGRKV